MKPSNNGATRPSLSGGSASSIAPGRPMPRRTIEQRRDGPVDLAAPITRIARAFPLAR
jgi:hypothetical protein